MPYGWDMDFLKLVMAVLLRAGRIEYARLAGGLAGQCAT
jgi:hypothetical protein